MKTSKKGRKPRKPEEQLSIRVSVALTPRELGIVKRAIQSRIAPNLSALFRGIVMAKLEPNKEVV